MLQLQSWTWRTCYMTRHKYDTICGTTRFKICPRWIHTKYFYTDILNAIMSTNWAQKYLKVSLIPSDIVSSCFYCILCQQAVGYCTLCHQTAGYLIREGEERDVAFILELQWIPHNGKHGLKGRCLCWPVPPVVTHNSFLEHHSMVKVGRVWFWTQTWPGWWAHTKVMYSDFCISILHRFNCSANKIKLK